MNKKHQIKRWYKALPDIHCDKIRGDVVFNKYGLHHTYFKKNNKKRSHADYSNRERWLKYAPSIIQNKKCTLTAYHSCEGAKCSTMYQLYDPNRKMIVVLRKFDASSTVHYFSIYKTNKKAP